MLRLLVGNEDLEVVEVALAIVAPGPAENLFNVWVTSLFTHPEA
jgi:hypothetical protein